MKLNFTVASAVAYAALTLQAFAAPPMFSANPADVKTGTYTLDPNHGKITWSLSHLGFSTYTGQFGNVTGKLDLDPADIAKSSLTAIVDIGSIGTLNPALDTELKGDKFFKAATFPTASFTSTKIERTGTRTAEIVGNLTLLGVTKPVTLSATFNQGGINPIAKVYEIGFEGHALLTRSQFGLTAYVPFVGDQVTLDIEGEFHLQS